MFQELFQDFVIQKATKFEILYSLISCVCSFILLLLHDHEVSTTTIATQYPTISTIAKINLLIGIIWIMFLLLESYVLSRKHLFLISLCKLVRVTRIALYVYCTIRLISLGYGTSLTKNAAIWLVFGTKKSLISLGSISSSLISTSTSMILLFCLATKIGIYGIFWLIGFLLESTWTIFAATQLYYGPDRKRKSNGESEQSSMTETFLEGDDIHPIVSTV